jgi:hypothetical protein
MKPHVEQVTCRKPTAIEAEQAGETWGSAGSMVKPSGSRRHEPAERRICGLCGRAFALVMDPGEEETEHDRLCPDCLTLPPPPAHST